MSLSKYCQVVGDVPISYSSGCNFGASAYVYANEKWWKKLKVAINKTWMASITECCYFSHEMVVNFFLHCGSSIPNDGSSKEIQLPLSPA